MTSDRAAYRMSDLHRLVNPRSIAVVGASETAGSFGQRTLDNLSGFSGTVIGVNPKYREVGGFPCVPALSDLTEPPDCVVICVARPLVAPSLADAIAIGAGAAIVYASGFAETRRADRVADQAQLVAAARAGGLRLAGPNCVGLANVRSGASMNFMSDCGRMVRGHAGPVAIVSQSGALGYAVLQGVTRGIGVSHYLTAGNSADVDAADYIATLADDPDVRAVICLLEGVKDGPRFLQAARLAGEAGKALIVLKAGNSEVSGKAALSHTGSLVGSATAYRAAFRDVGVIAVDDLEAALEVASFVARNAAPRAGRAVGIMSTSGGAGVIAADKAVEHGLALPDLAAATRAALDAVVPDFGSVANPADLTAEVLKTSSAFRHCLDAFVDDAGFSAAVVPLVFAHDSSTGARAPVIGEVAARTDCALAAIWMPEWLEGPGSAVLDADPKVTLFRSADRCFAAIRAWCEWHEGRSRPEATPRLSDPAAAEKARALIRALRPGGAALGERESKALLALYGIAVPGEETVPDPDAAAEAAGRVGFPVVVKVASPDILHKTEVSGIRLNLGDADAVREATQGVIAAARHHAPTARIEGVSVQAMAPPGAELVVGVQHDAQFGPMIVVGSGGVLVELLADATTALAPVSPDEARRMLASLRGYSLLTGFRGSAPRDVDAAADAICRLSEMAADLGDALAEVDVNPLIVGTSGAVAADALVVLA